ncbi:MAG: hypothetical protein A3F13_09950 [Gammaproteobacteria bacterium RIFCSPHIGHO2_12_FULL_40_19]|nr:MAG: hypothetical protein A3F13_09950 [Gammaproteobacteria bacterium RIFCSPHIGHO2_12_FULL_40_19]
MSILEFQKMFPDETACIQLGFTQILAMGRRGKMTGTYALYYAASYRLFKLSDMQSCAASKESRDGYFNKNLRNIRETRNLILGNCAVSHTFD